VKTDAILDLDAVGGQLIEDADTMSKPKVRELESHECRSNAVEIAKASLKNLALMED